MSTQETMGGHLEDRRVAQRVADIIPLQSLSLPEESFFDLEQSALTHAEHQAQRNRVIDREFLKHDKHRYGEVTTEVFTFENGMKKEIVIGLPAKQQADVPIVATTALATSVRGHNWYSMLQGMSMGYPYVLIGPEGGHANYPKTPGQLKSFIRNLSRITIRGIAEDMHEVMEIVDEDGHFEADTSIVAGESRGACAGIGFVALANAYDRDVIFAELTAPVFPVARSEIERNGHIPLETVKQVSFFKQLPLKMHPKRLIHMPETLNLNPFFLAHVAATVPTLLDGSTGVLARDVPTTAKIHNTIFENDSWSCPEGWNEIFADHPGVVNTLRPGNHMGITNRRTFTERKLRLLGLRDELTSSHNRAESINWGAVHMAGAVAIQSA